jgi:hypothetical protein
MSAFEFRRSTPIEAISAGKLKAGRLTRLRVGGGGAVERLRQRRDYFVERHRVKSLALFCGELSTRGRTPTKELVAGVKDSLCVLVLPRA